MTEGVKERSEKIMTAMLKGTTMYYSYLDIVVIGTIVRMSVTYHDAELKVLHNELIVAQNTQDNMLSSLSFSVLEHEEVPLPKNLFGVQDSTDVTDIEDWKAIEEDCVLCVKLPDGTVVCIFGERNQYMTIE